MHNISAKIICNHTTDNAKTILLEVIDNDNPHENLCALEMKIDYNCKKVNTSIEDPWGNIGHQEMLINDFNKIGFSSNNEKLDLYGTMQTEIKLNYFINDIKIFYHKDGNYFLINDNDETYKYKSNESIEKIIRREYNKS